MSKGNTVAGVAIVVVIAIIAIFALSNAPASRTTDEQKVVVPKTTVSTTPPITRSEPKPLATPTSNQGSVVLAIKDAPASLEGVTSVVMTVDKVRIRTAAGVWITLSETPEQFDLMELKKDALPSLLTRANLEKGTYTAVELSISNVAVIKNGVSSEAKIPSGRLTFMNLKIVVGAKQTATAVFDFEADKSFHITGNGKYIFTPVIKIEAKSDARAELKTGSRVDISGGLTTFDASIGMDENGRLKSGFQFDGYTSLEIVGNTIHVMFKDAKESEAKVSGEAALKSAINSGFIDITLSYKTETKDGKLVWKVTGTKNLNFVTLYIDASTGAIVGRE